MLTITDERMTRFWITLEQAVDFVIDCLERDGRRRDLRPEDPEHARHRSRRRRSRPTPSAGSSASARARSSTRCSLTEDESRHAYELDDGYVILPEYASWPLREVEGGQPLPDGFRYSSDNNDRWLDVDELAGDGGRT